MEKMTCIGGNLFQIAAKELGDALQWVNIASVNRLVDPYLVGQNELFIPKPSSFFANGIGPQ